MKKSLYCLSINQICCVLLTLFCFSCSQPESRVPEGTYASSEDVPRTIKPVARPAYEEKLEDDYRPLLWEIKWSSRRVFDFGDNYEKVCKTEFTNPYRKTIKEIHIGYEVKPDRHSAAERFEKSIELNLKPNQSLVVDTGVGCNDFFMFEVIFSDGTSL